MFDFHELYEPASVDEAIEMMKKYPKARIIAGGSDLLVQIRGGGFEDLDLISIYGLDALRGISMDAEGTLRIGALTSFSEIARHELIRTHVPVLGEAVDTVGGPQIRNIGTIGGNICNAHTGADSASTLFAYDALVELKDDQGVTVKPIASFYKKEGGTVIMPAQLLTAILIPKTSYEGYAGSYYKYSGRAAMDVDIIGCSANVRLDASASMIEDLRLSFGVMGPYPMRSEAAEQRAKGARIEKPLIHEVAALALEALCPRTDLRGSKAFRTHLAKELAIRTINEAIRRAGGKQI